MKKFFPKAFKITFLISLIALSIILGFLAHALAFPQTPLELTRITSHSLSVPVFSSSGLQLETPARFTHAPLSSIPEHVQNAFIAIEDKNFYSHHGISPRRILAASINNLKTGSFSQGASTITQQLIKNTHLSSSKTLSRKLSEVALALKLEKIMSKSDILENYLNAIYFGSGQTGIASAAWHYFSLPVQKLSLAQGALLAGVIKSPQKYLPTLHPDAALKRRNLVLSQMSASGFISEKECIEASNQPLSLTIAPVSSFTHINSYASSAIDEAARILSLTHRQLALGGYKIYTYQSLPHQLALEKALSSANPSCDAAMINICPHTGHVKAFASTSPYKVLSHPRQIGSLAKPILVYGPAVNENILSPASQILDQPLSIAGYSPKNVSGTYQGYVSTRTALSQSLNVPAVRAASYVGLDKIFSYAKKLRLPLPKEDFSYAIALGGLTNGLTLTQTASAFTPLASSGQFSNATFINYITSSTGQVVYSNSSRPEKVFRDDTAFLITDMLKTSARSGTARRLGDLSFEVASKTGTVGSSRGNTDAFNLSYTTSDLSLVWLGDMTGKFIKTAGGGLPTTIAKTFYQNIYKSATPAPFTSPPSVEKIAISQTLLNTSHRLVRASPQTPPLEQTEEFFSRFNLPSHPLLIESAPTLSGTVENGKAVLSFIATPSSTYSLYKITHGHTPEKLANFSSSSGLITFRDNILPNQKTEYFLTQDSPSHAQSKSVFLIRSPSSSYSKWYI